MRTPEYFRHGGSVITIQGLVEFRVDETGGDVVSRGPLSGTRPRLSQQLMIIHFLPPPPKPQAKVVEICDHATTLYNF